MSLTSVFQQPQYTFYWQFLHPEVVPVMEYIGYKDDDDDDDQ